MDFGALPPEINSARMYSGPGPGPMMAAAMAWNAVAGELQSTAACYGRVVTGLTGEEWLGPASTSMAAAAAPYVAWINSTGAHAELVANRARAAAAAYEQAFAMTVSPPVIAANRVQLQQLVATNVLGQNTPAIAATEAQYGEMWARDAAAMYGYAGHAAVATQMRPFTAPPKTTNSAGGATQAAAVSHASASKTLASTSKALQAMTTPSSTPPNAPTSTAPTSPAATTPASALSSPPLKLSDANSTYSNVIHSANFGARGICAVWRGLSGGMGAAKMAGSGAAAATKAAGGAAKAAAGAAHAAAGLGSVGGVAGHIGKAGLVGAMSVPPSWAPAVPAAVTTGPVSGGTWEPVGGMLGAVPQSAATAAPGMPGVPGAVASGRGVGFATPRYGARITVMPRPPIGG